MKTIKFLENGNVILDGKTKLKKVKYVKEYTSWYVIKDQGYV